MLRAVQQRRILLQALYPRIWTVVEIRKHLRMPKNVSISGEYTNFWTVHVPRQSTPEQMAQLLDCTAAEFEEYKSFMVGETSRYTRMGVMPIELLDKVLRGVVGYDCSGPDYCAGSRWRRKRAGVHRNR